MGCRHKVSVFVSCCDAPAGELFNSMFFDGVPLSWITMTYVISRLLAENAQRMNL